MAVDMSQRGIYKDVYMYAQNFEAGGRHLGIRTLWTHSSSRITDRIRKITDSAGLGAFKSATKDIKENSVINDGVKSVSIVPMTDVTEDEVKLLDQEYKLVFTVCGSPNDVKVSKVTGLGHTTKASASKLKTALKEYGLASDSEALDKFITDATAESSENNRGEPMIEFDIYDKLLHREQIFDLKPTSLKLRHGNAFDELVRGKSVSEIPLTDHTLIFWRRMANELLHYNRGVKLFWQQLRSAVSYISADVYEFWDARSSSGINRKNERKLVWTVVIDLAKLLPVLGFICVPGGTFVLMAMSRILPSSLPSTFQNAPRWEQYHLLKAMARDIGRKFKSDRIHEKDAHDRCTALFCASREAWEKTSGRSLNPFGSQLRAAVQDQIGVLQPREIHNRMTKQHVEMVCDALGIEPHVLDSSGIIRRRTPKLAAWIQPRLQILLTRFPFVAVDRIKRRKFLSRISKLRIDDRALAETPGEILALPSGELFEKCKYRGIHIAEDGQCHRMKHLIDKSNRSLDDQFSGEVLVHDDLMRKWLTQWVALSTIQGYDPVFLAIWSLGLELNEQRQQN